MHAGNRCWQIMTSRPRWTVNQQTRWTRKIQRKAFLFGYRPSTVNLEDLEAHVLAHSSERVFPDSEGDASKVETQKTEAQYSCLFSQKHKEIYSAVGKVWWLDNSRAQNPQRRMWISKQSPIRCRGTSSRHSVESATYQNFTRDGEEFTKAHRSRRRSLKLFVRTIYWNLASIVKNLIDQRQAELQNEHKREQKKRHQPYSCNPHRMLSGGWILWNAIAVCEMTKTSWQMGNL